MIVKHLPLKGLVEIYNNKFRDERGFFMETFNVKKLVLSGVPINFVQDNESFSKKGVLRGLHHQKFPHEQGKLVRVVYGKILDVAVDLRRESSTYGGYCKIILSSEKKNSIYIPPGFAHGFLALTDAVVQYKCTDFYKREAESGIVWNDETLAIDWGLADNEAPIISDKDSLLPRFTE